MHEWPAGMLIRAAGWTVAAVLFLIVLFLARESGGSLNWQLLTGARWDPVAQPPDFGALPLLAGSLWVTLGAAALAVPLGIATAVWLEEVAPAWLTGPVRTVIELLGAVPSVVLGLLGVLAAGPRLQAVLALPTGYTALTGSLLLAWMALPTIVALGAEAVAAVPHRYREASAALGATDWETLRLVLLPRAAPGLAAAAMLGLGRVLGETMVVLMVTGNVPLLARHPLQPVQTLTAAIAAEMGEAVRGGAHYRALFALGLVLFGLNLAITLAASALRRTRPE